MTHTHEHNQTHPAPREAFLGELWWLLRRVAFHAQRGSYVKGKGACVLVDTEPGEAPGTFHAGITVFPLAREPVDTAGIALALTGQMDGQPHIRPMRRGVTSRHGSLTLTNLPAGTYHLTLAQSLVAPAQPIPALKTAAGFATGPGALVVHEYTAEDGSLTCMLRETREHELLLEIQASPPAVSEALPAAAATVQSEGEGQHESGTLWVEYVITEPDAERVMTLAPQRPLAGCVALQPNRQGQYTQRISLGYGIVLPPGCHLRACLVPGPGTEEGEQPDGDIRAS